MKAEKFDYQPVRSIRAAAIVLGLLVCVFAAGASWLALRDEEAKQLKSLSALAEIGAQSIDGYLMALQGAMQLSAADILGTDEKLDPVRADAALKRLRAAFPELRIVTVAQLDGTIVASTERIVLGAAPTLAAQRTFIAARDERVRTGNRDVTIGRAFYGPLSREWVMPIGSGVWDSKGELKLILGSGLPLAKPQGLWTNAPLPAGAAMGLRRDDGYILVRNPIPAAMDLKQVYTERATGPLGHFLDANHYPAKGRVFGTSSITGTNSNFVFRRLAHFPLTFYVADPASNVVAAWWERIWAVYILWLSLTLVGYYVYRWALRRQIAWEGEKAAQIAKLEAANQELEDFAYTVAHDLKSPIRAIDAHAGMAIGTFSGPVPEGLGHRLAQIRRSAARMAELIDDLLEFSRYSRTTLARRRVDMDALVREVVADTVPADGGIDLAIGELPECHADPGLMRVVWTALLSNAVKYSANKESPAIEVGFSDGNYFVRDNGVGFDMAHGEKLFAVFSRLHGADEFEGTGAGLAIARRILERHSGSISAEAEPGQGAIFRFSVGVPEEFPEKEN